MDGIVVGFITFVVLVGVGIYLSLRDPESAQILHRQPRNLQWMERPRPFPPLDDREGQEVQ